MPSIALCLNVISEIMLIHTFSEVLFNILFLLNHMSEEINCFY